MSAMSQHQLQMTESLLNSDTWKQVRTLLVVYKKNGSIVFINGKRYPNKKENSVYNGSLPSVIAYALEDRRRCDEP